MEIFEPNLQLMVEPDGEYTLHAVTITPSSAYSAGRARPGIPADVRLLPEVFPVLLDIRVRRGPALQVLTPVRHQLRNLKLGAEHGKTSVRAFAMVGDLVVGSSSVPVGPVDDPPTGTIPVDTSDWYAWLNKMPPGPASLHVQGVVQLPTPGYDVRLVPASPQGIYARQLILDLLVTARPGNWPPIVTSVSVRYDHNRAIDYETVLIREPDGDTVVIDVEVVS